jgi:hypothetical protein
MSLLLRGGLIAVAVIAAFAGGFLLKSRLSFATVATEPPAVAKAQAKSGPATPAVRSVEHISAKTTVPANRTSAATADVILLPPAPLTSRHEDIPPIIAPPPADTRPAPPPAIPKEPDVPDPSDPGFQMLKNEWKINTTVLDKSAPLPAVIAEAKRNGPSVPEKDGANDPPRIPTINIDPLPPIHAPNVGTAPPPPAPPPAPATKLINNRSVELDFEVTKIGRSKIRSVELWTTRDGGLSWQKMDQMMGCESPFATRLTTEGHYGFKLVFLSESGKRTLEPRPGERPDASLELDTTPPEIRLHDPQPVLGQPGSVWLRWTMSDHHLDPTSVQLDYSLDGKAWTSIATGAMAQQNGTHMHNWTIPKSVPPRVLLRVTARDKAGNVGSAQSHDKVAVDLVVPEGKIKGVRVAGAGQENGPAPRVVDNARQVFSFWTEWSRLP